MSEDNNTPPTPPKLGVLPPLPPKKTTPIISFEEKLALKEKDKDASLDEGADAGAGTDTKPSTGAVSSLYHEVNSMADFLMWLSGEVREGRVTGLAVAYDGKEEDPAAVSGSRVLIHNNQIRLLGLLSIAEQLLRDDYMSELIYS